MAGCSLIRSQDNIPPDHSLILVAIVPTPRDLEIARIFGWYRIPFKFAPKIVSVDYLAFYQPASFNNASKQRIETFCEVKGVELVTRREIIQDEPNHPRADEEYYKIQLGPLHILEKPILADKWKRITFLYTTGERFASAKITNDLVVKSEERKLLWRSLRERAANFSSEHESGKMNIELDEDILLMLGELHRINDDLNWYKTI